MKLQVQAAIGLMQLLGPSTPMWLNWETLDIMGSFCQRIKFYHLGRRLTRLSWRHRNTQLIIRCHVHFKQWTCIINLLKVRSVKVDFTFKKCWINILFSHSIVTRVTIPLIFHLCLALYSITPCFQLTQFLQTIRRGVLLLGKQCLTKIASQNQLWKCESRDGQKN